ncbi:uncharacterized protein LOC123694588 [Colias croceus]|uniref:uncharacterized protein LOC123694588 n=1 Tax=Colias crocea TaxID=72248 RepID=UPI001E27B961|nr:uncharacterized protein LOC123694588 [Colias croceus]
MISPTINCARQPACQAWRVLAFFPPKKIHIKYMNSATTTRPLVPGSSAIPGYGSGHGNGGARGAKNHRKRSGYHSRRPLALVTYNARTLRTDEKIVELEEELSKLRWDVIGLSEVRRQGEDTITLTSGNLFFYREGDQQSQGGIGFIVRRPLINNIISIESDSGLRSHLGTLR